jgi:voltage-gated potassium channel
MADEINHDPDLEREALDNERYELLQRVEHALQMPMVVLGFVWLVLLVIDLTQGLSPTLNVITNVIWVLFIADFVLRFTLAPRKVDYLQNNWLTAISLLLPALRIFQIARVVRVLRVARATRGLQLVRVLGSVNRGMRALGNALGRRGFIYVVALSFVVTLVGAAAMFFFERGNPSGPGLPNYGAALWWTAMLITTLGSDYWPQSGEGRVLCFVLALYAFAVFGYVTATLATFFIDRDAESADSEVAGQHSITLLQVEVQGLREEVRELTRALQESHAKNNGGTT